MTTTPLPPKTATKTARELLLHAAELVSGERARTHGDMVENHQNIADLWNGYLGDKLTVSLTPTDVALMQVLLKIARTKLGDLNGDDFMDIAGYGSVAWQIASHIAEQTSTRVDDAADWRIMPPWL